MSTYHISHFDGVSDDQYPWVGGREAARCGADTRRLRSSVDAPELLTVRENLSRPVGGTAAFRDALEHTFRSEGGQVLMPATVDEILVTEGSAHGVRLGDGSMLFGDYVISPEICPNSWSEITTETSFVNGLVGAVTDSIYTP